MSLTRPSRRLAPALLLALLMGSATPGCSTIESITGLGSVDTLAELPATIQQVADLTANIAQWSSGIAGFVSDPQLSQLGGYVSQAGELLGSLQGMSGQSDGTGWLNVPGVSSITYALEKLSAFNVAGLQPLDEAARVEPAKQFTGFAETLSQLTGQFLSTR